MHEQRPGDAPGENPFKPDAESRNGTEEQKTHQQSECFGDVFFHMDDMDEAPAALCLPEDVPSGLHNLAVPANDDLGFHRGFFH